MRTTLAICLTAVALVAQTSPVIEPQLAGMLEPLAAAQFLLPVHGFDCKQLAYAPVPYPALRAGASNLYVPDPLLCSANYVGGDVAQLVLALPQGAIVLLDASTSLAFYVLAVPPSTWSTLAGICIDGEREQVVLLDVAGPSFLRIDLADLRAGQARFQSESLPSEWSTVRGIAFDVARDRILGFDPATGALLQHSATDPTTSAGTLQPVPAVIAFGFAPTESLLQGTGDYDLFVSSGDERMLTAQWTWNASRVDAFGVVITDTNIWRTHPPGALFEVDVHVVGSSRLASTVTCQWVDEHRQPLGQAIPVSGTPTVIQSPSTAPGFYGLVFASTNPDVSFPPQPAGFPSSVYGFAVLPSPPSGAPVIEPNSPFGLIQGDIEDPYLWAGSGPRVIGLHLKTKTWQHSVASWASEIDERTLAGHTELPLITDSPWDSVDTLPIATTQLDQIGTKFRGVLQAEPTEVEYWQAGREENAGTTYEQSHYFSNLLAKISRLRAEADAVNPAVKFAYSTRGDQMSEFEQLFASRAFGVYDGLAHDVYEWPDFPTPEGWLPGHISDIRTRMVNAGHVEHFFWFGECGLPVRGTNDPEGFFGYPASGSSVPGASLDYAATYLVKFHALAIANGIKRLYWYNYKNRGNDIDYAEHHFGLRSYTSSSSDPGYPFPAYVAYVTMLAHLKGCSFVELRHPSSNVYVFEFDVDGTAERRILAWVDPAQSATLALASLQSGLLAANVQTVSDIYGRPVSAISGEQITLDGRPLYLRF